MTEMNFLNLPAVHQAAMNTKNQRELRERRDKQWSDDDKLSNTRFLAGSAQVVDRIGQENPELVIPAVLEISEEMLRRGMLDESKYDPELIKSTPVDQLLAKNKETLATAMTSLAGRPIVDPGPQNTVGKTWVNPETQTMWGMTRDGQPFDTGVPAQQYALRPVETAEGVVPFDPTNTRQPQAGTPIPGTDPEAMRQVAVEDELATSEAARGRVQQPSGEFEAVPGSQAAIDEEQRQREIRTGATMKSIQAQTVVEDVTRLNELISSGKVPFGRSADWWDMNPNVFQPRAYRDAQSLVKSVQGNVGVDQLINIKKSGAGLGQVPQAQLDLLSRLLGELDLGQSEEQFRFTWERMGRVYDAIWQAADQEMTELGFPPPSIFSLTEGMTMVQSPEMARELIRDGVLKPGDKFITPDGTIKRVPLNGTQ